MSQWRNDTTERVRTAATIKRHGESEKTVLEIIRELKQNK